MSRRLRHSADGKVQVTVCGLDKIVRLEELLRKDLKLGGRELVVTWTTVDSSGNEVRKERLGEKPQTGDP